MNLEFITYSNICVGFVENQAAPRASSVLDEGVFVASVIEEPGDNSLRCDSLTCIGGVARSISRVLNVVNGNKIRRKGTRAKGLTSVDSAKGVGCFRSPSEVGVGGTRASQLQRITNCSTAIF